MTGKTIPASVFAILKHRWKEADPRCSSFETVFNDASYYHIRPGKQVETDMDVLAHDEAEALVRDGAFGSLAVVRDSGAVAINEHAQQALTDFCSEVYSAWAKYQRRITEAERTCPSLDAWTGDVGRRP